MSEVICDWLDVTYSPDDSALDAFESQLNAWGFAVDFLDQSRAHYLMPGEHGVVVLERTSRFHKISLSGGVLSVLRRLSKLRIVAGHLGSAGHRVTRLDAALDLDVDYPVHRRMLRRRHQSAVRLAEGKNALTITELTRVREDGKTTGTWYAGHRSKSRVTARCYDKQGELLEKRGELVPPRTRVELTFRKDSGASLSDFLDPGPIFWAHSAALLPVKMARQSPWEPSGGEWSLDLGPDLSTPFEAFVRRLESSPEVGKLASLGAEMGPEAWPIMQRHLLRVFESAYQEALVA